MQFAKGNVDYVFSLMNRFGMSKPEIFISSYCEFIQVPYLGAPPNIRAIAEDKLLTKLVFRSLGLNMPEGIGLSVEKAFRTRLPSPAPTSSKTVWSRFRRYTGRQHLRLLGGGSRVRPAPDGGRP